MLRRFKMTIWGPEYEQTAILWRHFNTAVHTPYCFILVHAWPSMVIQFEIYRCYYTDLMCVSKKNNLT